MNRIVFSAAAAALVSLAAFSGVASAQTFGHVSVNVGLPGLPMPHVAVVRPAPVMVAPQPVYGGHYRGDRGYDRGYDRRDYHRGYDRRDYRHDRGYYGTRWDRDGDGVPNRHDRRPMNPYRY